ncbi:MAG: TIGR03545 family protein [Ignavibacteriales bacterium]|nr:TIGR03545 family protein [Ignavibacteriales bacterium]
MRTKFVLFILFPALFLFLLVYLFADQWIESGLEYSGEKVVGAKVEIDGLSVTLSPVGVEFARLQVANPQDGWKNIFETGKVKFALDFGQLLRSKFIIETMEVNDLILGTKRDTDGTLEGKKQEQTEQPAIASASSDTSATAPASFAQQAAPVLQAKEEKKTPVFDIERIQRELKVDSILNVQNLRTVQYYDSVKQEVQRASEQWETTLAEIDKAKPKLAEVETNIKAVNVAEIKNLESAKSALENVKRAYESANEVSKSFTERKAALTDQVNRFSSAYAEGERLTKEDFNAVIGLARLPDVSMRGLAELILGQEMMQNVGKYLYWVDFARNNIPSGLGNPEKEEPNRRLEGQNIHFPVERSYPKLWIKKILVSGGTDKAQNPEYFYLKGEVLDISNNQRITGQPLTALLSGTKGGTTSLSFAGRFDRRTDLPVDDYQVKLAGLNVGEMKIGRSDFLPSKITRAVAGADVVVKVPGNRFESTSGIAFENLTMVFDSAPKNTVERIVKDVLSAIRGFNVRLRLWNSGGKFDMAFATDLDDQISSRTRKVIGDEVARMQNEIRSKVNEKIAGKRKEFETLFNQKKEEVTGKLKAYESQVNEKVAMVEGKKKEVEKKIDEETKKQAEGVKKKAEEKIKGLFKKN